MALEVNIIEEKNKFGVSFANAYIKIESFKYDSVSDTVSLRVVGYGTLDVGHKKRDQKKAEKELQKASLTDSQREYYEGIKNYSATSIFEANYSFKVSEVIPEDEYYALEQNNMLRLGYYWLKSIGNIFPSAEDILEPGQEKDMKMVIQKSAKIKNKK